MGKIIVTSFAGLLLIFSCKLSQQEANLKLHHAVLTKEPKAVKKYLEKGASVDYPEARRGWTPLLLATEDGNTEIAKILIDQGADANIMSTMNTKIVVLLTILLFGSHLTEAQTPYIKFVQGDTITLEEHKKGYYEIELQKEPFTIIYQGNELHVCAGLDEGLFQFTKPGTDINADFNSYLAVTEGYRLISGWFLTRL